MGGKGSGRKPTVERRHGTWQCYARGCRSLACRKAWRGYIAARRALRPRYYGEKPATSVVVPLSPLSSEILSAIEKRTAKSRRDIVEQLLRLHGGALRFEDPAA